MKNIKGFGIVHCGGCDKSIGFFPPDTTVDELELYCFPCAEKLKEGEDVDKNK